VRRSEKVGVPTITSTAGCLETVFQSLAEKIYDTDEAYRRRRPICARVLLRRE